MPLAFELVNIFRWEPEPGIHLRISKSEFLVLSTALSVTKRVLQYFGFKFKLFVKGDESWWVRNGLDLYIYYCSLFEKQFKFLVFIMGVLQLFKILNMLILNFKKLLFNYHTLNS